MKIRRSVCYLVSFAVLKYRCRAVLFEKDRATSFSPLPTTLGSQRLWVPNHTALLPDDVFIDTRVKRWVTGNLAYVALGKSLTKVKIIA